MPFGIKGNLHVIARIAKELQTDDTVTLIVVLSRHSLRNYLRHTGWTRGYHGYVKSAKLREHMTRASRCAKRNNGIAIEEITENRRQRHGTHICAHTRRSRNVSLHDSY